MEAQRWKRQSLSEFQLRTRCLSEREKAERDRGGTDKSVSLASTCRLLTDRQYVMRRPLFCAETSILKKSQEEKLSGVCSRDQAEKNFSSKPGEGVSPWSPSCSPRDVSPPSDLPTSPCGVWELGGRRSHLEPTLGSAESGLFSSILEVHRSPKPPQRPHLSSPVLNPTYTPRSGHWRSGQMGMGGGGGTKRKTMSPHQENYWACAIPKTGPPSPDRLSVDWEPDREYQALLDYTYPLRPPQGGGTLCQDLQDSGIELDHPCSATSLSGLDLSVKSPPGGRRGSPDHLGLTRSSGLCSTPSPLTEPPSLHYSLDSGGPYRYQRCPPPLSCLPPLPKSLCGGGDEFWPLPQQLEQLQLLSRQVREVTATIGQPVSASWESLEPGTMSIQSSVALKEDAEGEGGGGEEMSPAQTAGSVMGVDPVRGGLSRSGLREVEVLMEQLRGLSLPGSQKSNEGELEQSDSLMQQIQVFCSHLELLIQQLYSVSEKMELLAPPTTDIGSVKSCLADYQSLQRVMSRHQPLTSCVLHTGQLLLSCINTTSPLLRDALQLIQIQSGALQTCTERLFAAILSAMDSLTPPSLPSTEDRNRDQLPVEAQGSTS
ncbi:centrosomal protein of 68 kDa [Echeneis naucrates]|uniref:centrosomal protein of 68 kDa n=1 Tax=Echeneis naucrates TaxID=173247 RepID=UPI00111381C7|nr:centrosomal protein of 68 kDa [Echeneis naucrates]